MSLFNNLAFYPKVLVSLVSGTVQAVASSSVDLSASMAASDYRLLQSLASDSASIKSSVKAVETRTVVGTLSSEAAASVLEIFAADATPVPKHPKYI